MVGFVAINDYGNRFFMDNININGGNIILGMEGNNTDIHTSIYPNPTKGLFTIRTDAKNMKIEIYSILGNLVRKENIQNRIKQIDLSNEMSGVYFIKLKSENNTEQRKLIIQ